MHAKLIDGQNLHERYKTRTNECAGNFFFSPPCSFLQRFRCIFADYSFIKEGGGFMLAGTCELVMHSQLLLLFVSQ